MPKKTTILLLSLIAIVIIAFTGCAAKTEPYFDIYSIKSYRDIPGITGEEIAAIEALKAEGRSFSFGNIYSTEGFVLSDGSCTGFSPRLGELLSNLFGITFTLEFHDLNTIMNGLENMTIDFTSQLIITPERQSRYIMSNPILQRSLAILTYGDHKIETTRDLNGLRVGILERSSVWEFITNSYPDLEIEAVPLSNLVQESGMLKSGKIDAIISISTVLTYDFSGTEFNLIYDILPLAYSPAALSTANPEFAPIISVVNKYLAAGGLDKLFELYKSGEAEYKKHTIRQILSPEERAYLEGLDKKVPIVLGTDTYPVSFYNENDGEFQGIAIDVLTEISKITGIEFEVINDKDTSWGAILEMLKTGKAALISDLIITDERKEFFTWPQTPFYSTSYAFFSKAEYPYLELYQIEQRSVAIVDWCATHQVYNQWFPNSTNVVLYDSQDEALDALEKNEVDLFFNLGYILYYQKNYREKPNYKANYTFPVFNNIFFGLNINEKELSSIIDKTISYIDTDKISYDWTSRSFDYSRILAQERVNSLTIFIAALLLVLFIIIVLTVNIANNKKVITKQRQKLELALEQAANARDSLEETHDILTSILNKSDIMIYVTDKDTDEILFMNDYMKQQYDIKDDVTGIPCYKVLQVGMDKRCDFCPCYELDKDPDNVIVWEECNLRTRRHYRKTDRYIDWPGGKKVHIQHSVDITEIAAASEHVRMVFENAPVGLTIFDENLNFVDCNDAVLKMFGLTKGAYSNYFFSTLHSPEFQPDGLNSRDKAIKILKRVMSGETMKIEWLHSLPDGQPLPVELTLVRMNMGDKYVGLSYLYDMREQIRLREEIEKRKEAERIASEHFKIMLDTMPDICNLWDKEGKVIDCNEAALKLFGFEDKESYFENFLKLAPEIQPDGKTATAEIAARELAKVFEEGKAEYEYTAQRLDGTPLPQHVTLTRVPYKGDYIAVGYGRDLREQKQMAEEIEVMFENAPVGLTVFDENFKFIDCNEAVLKIYGVTREFYSNFFGSASHSPEFQPDGSSSRDKAMEVVKRVMDGETMRIEWVHSLPDGQPLPVELTMIRVIRDDKYVGLGYIYDMREQIRLKKEIETALIETQEASRAKSNFLSVMSHEMRTPMNAIIGMTSIGKKTDNIDGKNHALDKIEDASSHLLGVINDVLDMAKIEANKLELTPVEFNFEKVIHRVISVVNFRVSEKQQQLYVNIDKKIPNFLVGDGQRLAQVITNLLSNAVKFTSEGGEIQFDASLLYETSEHCELRIGIADNGIGIAPEHHEKLFDMFEQAESGTSRKYGGTGLGLVISKNIVELMGGRIWVESELGKGARFAFTIKVQRGTKNPRSLLSPGVNWDNVRVLAVDDDKEIHNQFNDIFDSLDIKCDTAIGGLEACRMIEERGEYDIYFIDWRMPGMDGVELTRLIKTRVNNRQSVVIMITAMDWEQIKEDASRAGVDKHLLKPLFPSMIIDCMNECFGVFIIQEDKHNNFADKKLLLAEDIEINREILIALLEDTGINIDWVENGEEALNKLEAEPDKYDIVFMDVQMPIMDGLEATRRIRALPAQQRKAERLPIIAMTANVFKDDVEACLAAGMNDHLGKPLDIEKVLEILHKYLKV